MYDDYESDAYSVPASAVEVEKNVTVPVSTDKGLCGGINSTVSKYARGTLKAFEQGALCMHPPPSMPHPAMEQDESTVLGSRVVSFGLSGLLYGLSGLGVCTLLPNTPDVLEHSGF
jgi:hypothetical protein